MNCNLCNRKCNVNRNIKLGFCSAPNKMKIARAALHFWEEPCISGENGSGTIFFSHCNLKCIFCQNYDISTLNNGKEITIEEFSDICIRLQNEGANNINLVTPTHYIYQIIDGIKLAKEKGLTIPVVYNTSSYETVESINLLKDTVDIFLPDLKYYDNTLGEDYSKVKNYFEYATKAIDKMYEIVGENVFDDDGLLKKGMIVRHLCLPGHTEDSKKVIEYLYNKYKDSIYISIMNQYTPIRKIDEYENLNRTLTSEEYDEVIDYAISLGVENAFIQEGETQKESFIPDFTEFQ